MGFIGIRAPQSSGWAQHGPQSTPKAPPPPPPPGLYPGLKINQGHSFFFISLPPRVYTRQVPGRYLLSIRRRKKINKCHACCLGLTLIINPPTHLPTLEDFIWHKIIKFLFFFKFYLMMPSLSSCWVSWRKRKEKKKRRGVSHCGLSVYIINDYRCG